MPFIEEDVFLGHRIDLLGRATGITWNAAAVGTFFPIFTTNNKQWPAGSGETFIAFVTFERGDGGTTFIATTTVSLGAQTDLNWCVTAVSLAFGTLPNTLYVGQGLTGATLPGAYANGVSFGVSLAGYTPAAATGIILSAYGWAT